jgi:hypothetical protein
MPDGYRYDQITIARRLPEGWVALAYDAEITVVESMGETPAEALGHLLAAVSPPKHFGPMHGERTRRHQMEVDGPRTPVLSVYEHQVEGKPRLAVELTAAAYGSIGNERADLTVAEARALREWLAEFIVAWEDEA